MSTWAGHEAELEHEGIELGFGFLLQHRITPHEIEDGERNLRWGDAWLDDDDTETAEVKRQPIKPTFPELFVEVAALSSKQERVGGALDVARILDVPLSALHGVDPSTRLACSVHWMENATWVIYAQRGDGGPWLLFLEVAELKAAVRRSLLARPWVNGAGRSRPGTLAVFVPNPRDFWTVRSGLWVHA